MDNAINPVTLFLISIAGIFLIGALGEVIFQRTNIPDVIWLILAGIVLGPTLGVVTPDMLKQIAPYFAALTLVIVLFEGGAALKLTELSQAAPRSSLLAVTSFSISVAALAAASVGAAKVGWLPDSWTWTHGLLLGAILGGSSSIIIMPAMAQARLPAKLANLVNLESALTDAFCVVGTSAIIDVMVGGGGAGSPTVALAKSFSIGLVIGGGVGLVWILFLRFLHSNEHAYPLTLSALLILYVVIDNAGGSATLGILTVAIMLGNAPLLADFMGLKFTQGLATEVRGFHRQMAFIVKSFFFVFIGAMLGPPWSLLLLGFVLAGVLYASRIPAVRLSTLGSDFSADQRNMIGVAMPRGMAAGVLATLPVARGVEGTEQLPVVVFACVFTTILIFAVGFPVIKRRLPPDDDAPPVSLPAGAARPSLFVPAAASSDAGDSALQPTLLQPTDLQPGTTLGARGTLIDPTLRGGGDPPPGS
jgi:cell volume regulation protein A